jgi:hypothetical protein
MERRVKARQETTTASTITTYNYLSIASIPSMETFCGDANPRPR